MMRLSFGPVCGLAAVHRENGFASRRQPRPALAARRRRLTIVIGERTVRHSVEALLVSAATATIAIPQDVAYKRADDLPGASAGDAITRRGAGGIR